ncbi:sigma-54 dependent transcriptional regulator [Planktomarina temperata]|nr:sigma-54 dependent transcriptional regulator [Planktomarina temperata]
MMTNYLIDAGDDDFSQIICCALNKRGVEWSSLGDEVCTQTLSKERHLIISDKSKDCDVNSDKFETYLRLHKITKVVVLVANSETFDIKVKRNGAIKYFHMPVDFSELSHAKSFYLNLFLEQFLVKHVNLPCDDPETADLVALLCKLAGSNASVLINGPTGTGKEVVAKLLHAKSARKDEAFIAVNCAAIPENMLESMLFGHEKGAFTGALQSNVGLFRAAHSGTILLDEISEMPLTLQSKLLRVLQEKVVTPVGSTKEIAIDIRVLATTNRNMQQEIQANNFREDLFYRLNVFPVSTCALKSRPLDIPAIAAHLLTRNVSENGTPKILSTEALNKLVQHEWPGNVRELDNVIQRAEILSCANEIGQTDIVFDNDLTFRPRNTFEALNSKLDVKVG